VGDDAGEHDQPADEHVQPTGSDRTMELTRDGDHGHE
jgi:hypothetical protein